jgi:hypothetical protein
LPSTAASCAASTPTTATRARLSTRARTTTSRATGTRATRAAPSPPRLGRAPTGPTARPLGLQRAVRVYEGLGLGRSAGEVMGFALLLC